MSDGPASLSGTFLSRHPVTVVAMDAGSYARVVGGSPADGQLNTDLAAADAAHPAGASLYIVRAPRPFRDGRHRQPDTGSHVSLELGGKTIPAVVHAVESRPAWAWTRTA